MDRSRGGSEKWYCYDAGELIWIWRVEKYCFKPNTFIRKTSFNLEISQWPNPRSLTFLFIKSHPLFLKNNETYFHSNILIVSNHFPSSNFISVLSLELQFVILLLNKVYTIHCLNWKLPSIFWTFLQHLKLVISDWPVHSFDLSFDDEGCEILLIGTKITLLNWCWPLSVSWQFLMTHFLLIAIATTTISNLLHSLNIPSDPSRWLQHLLSWDKNQLDVRFLFCLLSSSKFLFIFSLYFFFSYYLLERPAPFLSWD